MRPFVFLFSFLLGMALVFVWWDQSDQPAKRRWSMNALAALKTNEMQPYNLARALESGNIGRIERLTPYDIELHLRSDNDQDLPRYWRQWWYTEVDELPTDKPVTFTLKGRGHWNYYVPVYSYDNLRWHHFDPQDVKQPGLHDLTFKRRFAQSKVYLARYYPYTYSKLTDFIKRRRKSPFLMVDSLGTSKYGLDVPALTITDPRSTQQRAQVIVHARTHPGEVASSYLVEGMMNFLLGKSAAAAKIRKNLIVRVVPILNVDGVVIGNNRVNPEGINLEGKWYTQGDSHLLDFQKAPFEVQKFYRKIKQWKRQGPPVTMALNIHSSNGTPADKTFFFPHFGPRRLGYNHREAKLWRDQLRFISLLNEIKGSDWFNEPPRDGKRDFLEKSVPESWWWKVLGPRVMALTIEATFGNAGNTDRWIKPNDIRGIGRAVGQALGPYHDVY